MFDGKDNFLPSAQIFGFNYNSMNPMRFLIDRCCSLLVILFVLGCQNMLLADTLKDPVDSLPPYEGLRVHLTNVQLIKLKNNKARIKYNVVNTGRKDVFSDRFHPLPKILVVEFEDALKNCHCQLLDYQDAIRYQFYFQKIDLPVGKSIQNLIMEFSVTQAAPPAMVMYKPREDKYDEIMASVVTEPAKYVPSKKGRKKKKKKKQPDLIVENEATPSAEDTLAISEQNLVETEIYIPEPQLDSIDIPIQPEGKIALTKAKKEKKAKKKKVKTEEKTSPGTQTENEKLLTQTENKNRKKRKNKKLKTEKELEDETKQNSFVMAPPEASLAETETEPENPTFPTPHPTAIVIPTTNLNAGTSESSLEPSIEPEPVAGNSAAPELDSFTEKGAELDKIIPADKMNCSDVVLTGLRILKESKNFVTLEYTLTNFGAVPAKISSDGKTEGQIFAIKAFLSASEKLTRGSLPLGGTFIDKLEKGETGLLEAFESYTGKLKLEIRKKTRFTPNLILSLDPYLSISECDRTNNTAHVVLKVD